MWPASPTSRSGFGSAGLEPEDDGESRWPDAMRYGKRWFRRAVSRLDARLAVRTSEERVRAIAGRADGLLQAANQERAARLEHEARPRHHRGAWCRGGGGEVHDLAREVCRRVEQSISGARRPSGTPYSRPMRSERLKLRHACARSRELDEEIVRLTRRAAPRTRSRGPSTGCASRRSRRGSSRNTAYRLRRSSRNTARDRLSAAERAGDGRVRAGPRPRRAGERSSARAVRPAYAGEAGRPRGARSGLAGPSEIRSPWRNSRRWKSATNSLSTQLEDLKATRRDLLTVVKEVDERILEVFTRAYQDVAAEFETIFATLFPGGDGRLVPHRPG